MLSEIRLVRDYLCAREKVWDALTAPAQMAQWMIDARPEGFSPVVGTRFKFIGAPRLGWDGVVRGEVLEAIAPELFSYAWLVEDSEPMQVTYRLHQKGERTRFSFAHTGFTGLGGYLLSKFVITPLRKQMFDVRLPVVLGLSAAYA